MASKKAAAAAAGQADKDVWLVLLCGLPGSGKSTLRTRLVAKRWSYVSQDELGTSEACEKALTKALKHGQSCILDRCNVTPKGRSSWITYVKNAVDKGDIKGVKVHFEAVWMATPPEVCRQRAVARVGHETLSPEKAAEVIDDFCRGLKPPEYSGKEPYEGVHFVLSPEDADLVLQRYADPKKVDTSVKTAPPGQVLAAAAAAAAAVPAAAPAAADVPGDDEGDASADGAAGSDAMTGGSDEALARAALRSGAEVFYVRHGERADRARMRDDGWPDDAPLTKEGRQTAKRAGAALRSLASLPWAPAVYASPFHRCLQTSDEVGAELGLPVRVEPGLSELCIQRIFAEPPRLRPAPDSVAGALQRTEVDHSAAPVATALPVWPERARDANARILRTVRTLMVRHPGCAICIVGHSHGLVEATRHLPRAGGGTVGSQSEYCAMSHVDASGRLLRALDLGYLKLADSSAGRTEPAALPAATGSWGEAWRWQPYGEVPEETSLEVDALFDTALEEVLSQYPAFNKLFNRGTEAQKEAWREGWPRRCPELRRRLERARAGGLFA